ncbi:MAG: acyltransferase [Verrucomicrobia bacterium]|nr:acyltransferase [Verrucomicrobiota bacterium]
MESKQTERETENAAPIRLPELDSVRGFAALWVYGYHVWQFGGCPTWRLSVGGATFDAFEVMRHGPAGVDLFMVLSGFCLFWPLVNGSRSALRWHWRGYAMRRVTRILPPYYGAILYSLLLPNTLVILVRGLGWDVHLQALPSAWQVISHLLFIHTFFAETWASVSGSFWSMGLEAQFYAVFPALVWAWRRIGLWAIVAAAGGSLLYRVVAGFLMQDGDPLSQFLVSITFLGRWMQFAGGMAAALYVGKCVASRQPANALRQIVLGCTGFLCVLAGLSGFVYARLAMPWRDVLLAVGYSCALAALCRASAPVKSVFQKGILPKLGRISYSFFLIHQPTSWYLMELFHKKFGVSGVNQVLLGYTAGLFVTLLFSWCFFQIFERPFLAGTQPGKISSDPASARNSAPEGIARSVFR